MKCSFLSCGLLVLAALAHANPIGPVGAYYVTSGDSHKFCRIQGQSFQCFNESADQGAIAVTNTVNLLGRNNNQSSQYTLGGALIDNSLATANGFNDDGTTDGTHNYYISWTGNSGNVVYETNPDWSNPTALFNVAEAAAIGIAYDPFNDSLWVSSLSSSTIEDLSMSGGVLSSFTGNYGAYTALGFDTQDGTLWMSEGGSATFQQYSTSGQLLQTDSYALGIGSLWGGDIVESSSSSAVPEPFSLLLFGTGLLGLRRVLPRRR